MRDHTPRRALRSLALGALLTGCGRGLHPADAPPPDAAVGTWFQDVTAVSGVDFRHESGLDGSFFLPEIIGSGGALFDYDGDGDLDLYLVTSGSHAPASGAAGPSNRLFRQEDDGRFRDRTREAGLLGRGYGMGAAVGDLDNDGDLDLYVTNDGADVLYRNDGDGSFTDVSAAAGISGEGWSTSAGFCDLDGDGWLDLFVVTYVRNDPTKRCTDEAGLAEYCKPAAHAGAPDVLYHNDGDGSFTDVSAASGVGAVASRGLGLACSDFDGDGRLDVFVANDGERNELWINRGDGRFEDRAVIGGAAVNLFGNAEASMGVALGDVDGDLGLDLFVTNLSGETNTLYSRVGQGVFQDRGGTAGLGPGGLPHTGFGTALLDADRDGDLDLVVVNGRVTRKRPRPEVGAPGWRPSPETYREDYGEPNLLYENDGAGHFHDACARAPALCGPTEVSRGLLVGDLDGDGGPDLVLTNSNGPVQVLHSSVPGGHWLAVRAVDPALGRDAVGSVVRLVAGGREQLRPVSYIQSYLTTGEATVHFGLGVATTVDALVVVWPDGSEERFEGTAADRRVELVRGAGRPGRGAER